MLRVCKQGLLRWKFLTDNIPKKGLLIFVFSYVAFSLLSLAALAGRKQPNALDARVAHWVHERPALHGHWVQQISRLGSGEIICKGCAASVLILFLLRKWSYVPVLLIGVLGQLAFNKSLQDVIGRPRPTFEDIPPISAFAFPSGHAGAAAAFFGFWILFLVTEYGKSAFARLVVPALAACVLTVGASRIFLLAHWMTDVAGAFFFAIAWLLLVFWINERMYQQQPVTGVPSTDCKSRKQSYL
jgi:membrane-associated phospholipid phosphatase